MRKRCKRRKERDGGRNKEEEKERVEGRQKREEGCVIKE